MECRIIWREVEISRGLTSGGKKEHVAISIQIKSV